MNVLVVEDERLLADAIARKMKFKGISVTVCYSSSEALKILEKQKEKPNAIWLDYYLPDMNGLEFLERVKHMPGYETIPVYVVSNTASENKVQAMLKLGAQKYILKSESRLEDIIDTIAKETS